MILSHLCIRRPIMTLLVTLAMLMAGWIAYQNLPVAELPNVDFPVISVSVNLPGASPETMAVTVASPLERQFSSIPGLESMNSTSGLGITQITLIFALERDIDAAAQDVQSAIAAAQQFLPKNLAQPPVYRKVNPADLPIIYIGMTSKTVPLSVVNHYAENMLSKRISTIQGVAQVSIFGAQKYAVRILVDPNKMAIMKIGLNEIEKAIQDNNVLLPTGVIETQNQELTIKVQGQLENAAAYKPLVIAYRNGAPVRLQDVATIEDGVENNKVASWIKGERGIVLSIKRQPGSNTVEIAKKINEIIPELQAMLPASIRLSMIYDRATFIEESITDVKHTLFVAICLVVLVIFLFLRNLSATFIVSMALPVSLIGTFAGMYFLDFNLDNLSLLALVLSVGFVVDDAIVMLENIVRHVERGEAPLQAAFKGSKEIGFTILSMTISLVAVFIPVLFIGGIVGRILNEFAVTICLAILISGVTSLTLTPMLCSKLLTKTNRTPIEVEDLEPIGDKNLDTGIGEAELSNKKTVFQNKIKMLFDISEKMFSKMYQFYDITLVWSLKHNKIILSIFLGTILLSLMLYIMIPKGFLPNDDVNQIVAFTEGDRDFSFSRMSASQQEISKILSSNANIETFVSVVGAGGTRVSVNSGFIFMRLKPRSERRESPEEIIQDLRGKLKNVVGVNAYLQNPPVLRVGGQLTKAQYQYTLQDVKLDELYKWTEIYKQKFREIPGFLDVTTNLDNDSPNVILNINRDKASTLGLSMSEIQNSLGSVFAAKQISTIYTSENQYFVILEANQNFEKDLQNLSRLYVRSNNGVQVPLSEIMTLQQSVQPLTINHLGQLPSATISFNLAPHMALGQALEQIKQIERTLNPPISLLRSVQGTAQSFQTSLKGLNYLLILAIVTIYIVLGILYESFIHPLTILSGIPSAGMGALLTLIIFGQDLNLYAFTGIIMLIGIVKKNAIMMVDFALENQRNLKQDPYQAIYQACLVRFRPIMMTTFAALLGTLPIALGIGAGAQARQPLGLAVVGGLLFSQILTLYITPVIYLYLEKTNHYLNKVSNKVSGIE